MKHKTNIHNAQTQSQSTKHKAQSTKHKHQYIHKQSINTNKTFINTNIIISTTKQMSTQLQTHTSTSSAHIHIAGDFLQKIPCTYKAHIQRAIKKHLKLHPPKHTNIYFMHIFTIVMHTDVRFVCVCVPHCTWSTLSQTPKTSFCFFEVVKFPTTHCSPGLAFKNKTDGKLPHPGQPGEQWRLWRLIVINVLYVRDVKKCMQIRLTVVLTC